MTNNDTASRQLQDRLLWQRLTVAISDLRLAEQYAAVLIAKGWHHSVVDRRRRAGTYMHQSAYTTAFVVAYGRPFTESRSLPKLPTRLLRLTHDDRALHLRLLKLRNTVYAHSDVGSRDLRKFTFLGEAITVERAPSMHLELAELHQARAMILKSQVAIRNRQASLASAFPDDA